MPEPLRILHVLVRVQSGGVEQRRLTLARRLDPTRYRQRVACLDLDGQLPDELRRHGVDVRRIGEGLSPFALRAHRDLLREIREFRPHVIHGAVMEGVILAAIAGSLGRVPRIVIEEIDYPITRSWRGHLLFRTLAWRADECVAVSEAVRRYLIERAGLPAGRVRTIFNGVEPPVLATPEEADLLREELSIPPDAFVVGSVGRVVDRHKRFSDLICAFARPEVPDRARLLVVGDGVDLGALRDLASSLDVADRVVFSGYRKDVGHMLSLMDVFALVSNRESFGLVLAEAMFAGLPIITTGLGGMADVVRDGEEAVFVPLGDPPAIAGAVRRLADDPELRSAIGERALARAARFSGARYAAEVAALYDQLTEDLPR